LLKSYNRWDKSYFCIPSMIRLIFFCSRSTISPGDWIFCPLCISRLKSSVIFPIFGRYVWWGAKSTNLNQALLLIIKLHRFRAECREIIFWISVDDNISAIIAFLHWLPIHHPLHSGSTLVYDSNDISSLSNWSKRTEPIISCLVLSIITLCMLCSSANLVSRMFWFSLGDIGTSFKKFINCWFFCQRLNLLDNSFISWLVRSFMVRSSHFTVISMGI